MAVLKVLETTRARLQSLVVLTESSRIEHMCTIGFQVRLAVNKIVGAKNNYRKKGIM
jgi:hypothetical protein